jgi:hypothetical protein
MPKCSGRRPGRAGPGGLWVCRDARPGRGDGGGIACWAAWVGPPDEAGCGHSPSMKAHWSAQQRRVLFSHKALRQIPARLGVGPQRRTAPPAGRPRPVRPRGDRPRPAGSTAVPARRRLGRPARPLLQTVRDRGRRGRRRGDDPGDGPPGPQGRPQPPIGHVRHQRRLCPGGEGRGSLRRPDADRVGRHARRLGRHPDAGPGLRGPRQPRPSVSPGKENHRAEPPVPHCIGRRPRAGHNCARPAPGPGPAFTPVGFAL